MAFFQLLSTWSLESRALWLPIAAFLLVAWQGKDLMQFRTRQENQRFLRQVEQQLERRLLIEHRKRLVLLCVISTLSFGMMILVLR